MQKGVFFCAHPLEEHVPDPQFQAEYEAAKRAGFLVGLFSLEKWLDEQQLKMVSSSPFNQGLYRGWMLTGDSYTGLYQHLQQQGITLCTNPTAYQTCHYFPDAYPYIQPYTAKSIFVNKIEGISQFELASLLEQFKNHPILVKDFVKSRKENWLEACYISSAEDQEQVWKVVQRFIALQADRLNRGFVFRQFEQLEHAGVDSHTGMPITKEYRLFYVNHQLLSYHPNWQGASGKITHRLPLDTFQSIAEQIPSPFFTMDVAKKKSGEWMIIELGDGQVSHLPEEVDVEQFYKQLAKLLEK